VDDIQYHLYVLDKVRRGLEDAQTSGALSQEEAEKAAQPMVVFPS